jgi:Tol biopolymer transport system component
LSASFALKSGPVSNASLSPGVRFGPYEVVSALGAGGMGEVYRARDTKLGRDVALKILPAAFAGNRDRLMRFEREARTLAALNHPNIAQVYGLEDAPSGAGAAPGAIVMELVEGGDLSVRIARGPVPLDEALPIARQIAEALEAAHALGIVHRDLKPSNIKLRSDGTVKVLDFGLAKALDPLDPLGGHAGDSTLTSPAETIPGMILGTAAYMAPEQAKGKPLDKRVDIWAFGCVVYELLTGVRAFHGEDSTDTIVAIVSRDPDWTRLPAATPASVTRLLRRCLVKDRRNRLPDIGVARLDLDDARLDAAADAVVPGPAPAPTRWLPIAAGLALATAVGVLAGRGMAPSPPPTAEAHVVRFAVVPGDLDTSDQFPPEVSPDGSQVLFVARPRGGGALGLHIYDVASGSIRRLEGTDNANSPFWSGDGRSIGFVAGGRLLRIDTTGGSPRAVVDVQESFVGAAWNRDDVMVVSLRYGFVRIPAGGGPAVQITTLDRSRQENSHRWPQFLPDGQRFVFVARSGRPDRSSAYLGFLDGRPPVRLMESSSQVRYASSGHLVYVQDDSLVARAFDAAAPTLVGDPIRIADGAGSRGTSLRARFSISDNGVLVHQTQQPVLFQLRWYDRTGAAGGMLGAADTIANHRISPDATRVVIDRADNPRGGRSVWLVDIATGRQSRVTFGESDDWQPIWSRDGERILFGSYRNGPLDLYQRPANGATPDAVLVESDVQKEPSDWSRDGATVLVTEAIANTRGDLVAIEVATGARTVVAATDALEQRGRFSPDDRWVAYTSDESGRAQVYVQPFPPTGAKWQISTAGGMEPKWRGDGRELYYLEPGRGVMAVTVDSSRAFEHSGPTLLVAARAAISSSASSFEVTADGRRFLVRERVSSPDPTSPMHLILNLPALLTAPRPPAATN